MRALDELLTKWRKNPDAQITLALCSHLGSTKQEEIIREVGVAAETWHRKDLNVMLAVGRMYLEAALYAEAQSALVAAGKVDPNEAAPYRYLGEVLLRRGDAVRSEKVLARAIELGRDDDDTRLWHDRASVYMGLQKRIGAQAVADELNRTVPVVNSIPPPAMQVSHELMVDDELVSTRRGATAQLDAAPVHRPSSLPPPPRPPALSRQQPLPHPSSRPPPPIGRTLAGLAPAAEALLEHARSAKAQAPVTAAFARIPMAPAVPQFSSAIVPPAIVPPAIVPPAIVPPAIVPPAIVPPAIVPPVAQELWTPGVRSAEQNSQDGMPTAQAVLQQLAEAGVYDPEANSNLPWEAPLRHRPKGLWLLAGALILVIGGAFGAHRYQSLVRAREIAEARTLGDEVHRLLCESTPHSLAATEDKFKRIFALDSTSQRAALLWLRNRVLAALVLGEEPRGIAGAIQRMEQLKAPVEQIAVGKVAIALFEGDLPSAASSMAKLDAVAAGDPFYALISGVVLDRAGEAGALARYRKAIELDPEMRLAHILAAQLALLRGGPDATAVLDAARAKLGDSAAGKALQSLSWALGSRDAPLPAQAQLSDEEINELPQLLRAVPLVTKALQALTQGNDEQAVAALEGAIQAAGSPQVSTWLGFVALDMGKAELARAAALRAMRFSAVYEGARILAARVAVVGGRLDEAKRAVEGLDPSEPEVALVHTTVAYEGLDLSTLEDMTPKLESGARSNLAALAQAHSIALGRKYPDVQSLQKMANPAVIYGVEVALDALLDKGELKIAEQILSAQGDAATPVLAVRRARLLRYLGKADDAVSSSDGALREGAPTQRALIESVHSLLAASNTTSAKDLVMRYPAVLGSSAEWLKALIDVGSNNPRRAKVTVAGLEPFPSDSPLILRVLVARTLAAVGDRRAKSEIAPLLRAFPKNPDVAAAARSVGLLR